MIIVIKNKSHLPIIVDPIHALTDTSQQITLAEFENLCQDISKIAHIIDRDFLRKEKH